MEKFILFFCSVILLLSGCGRSDATSEGPSSRSATPSAVEVYIMAGRIESNAQAAVTTKISARVSRIFVDIGSKVKKGDSIIILDTNDLEAQVKLSEATVLTAQANLDNTLAGSRPEQISQAQASFESARKNFENTKSNFERIQGLYNIKAVSQQQFETAQTQFAGAEAQYKSAQDQLTMLKQGATKETVAILQKQMQQAQASLEVAKTQLSNGIITAPISGTVTAKEINVGELATPGHTLISIVNNDDVYVNAYLPADMASQAKEGQPVIVKVSEVPDRRFEGEITVVNGAINALAKNILLRVSFKQPDSSLKPGMFAEIAFKK